MTSLAGCLRRDILTGALFAIACGVATNDAIAEQNPIGKLFGGGDVKYKTYKDATNRFEIAYPEKDWRLQTVVGSRLAGFARDDGAALFVDHVKLLEPLTPTEIQAMPVAEVELLKSQDLPTKDFKTDDAFETRSGKGVLINYSRIGRGPELLVQFTIAIGTDLFRVNGVAPERLFKKYEPILMYMIQSFKAPTESPAPPGRK